MYAVFTYEAEGVEILFHPPESTRSIYDLHVGILLRDITDAQKIYALAHWCAEFTPGHSPQNLLDVVGAELPKLALAMSAKSGLSPDMLAEVRTLFDIGTGADEYDPSADEKPCTCTKCMGLGEVEGAAPCKFDGISIEARNVSGWAYLVANPQYLDSPYTLYQLAQLKNVAGVNGVAARRQKAAKDRELAEQQKRTREKYGHKW